MRVELTLIASDKNIAPDSLTLLLKSIADRICFSLNNERFVMYNDVRIELNLIASDNELAPNGPILFLKGEI